jgi:hypothetical protein
MIIETFRQAIQNVWSNKLRTFLTMLGIIIGVMAVIVIVGLGNGMCRCGATAPAPFRWRKCTSCPRSTRS